MLIHPIFTQSGTTLENGNEIPVWISTIDIAGSGITVVSMMNGEISFDDSSFTLPLFAMDRYYRSFQKCKIIIKSTTEPTVYVYIATQRGEPLPDITAVNTALILYQNPQQFYTQSTTFSSSNPVTLTCQPFSVGQHNFYYQVYTSNPNACTLTLKGTFSPYLGVYIPLTLSVTDIPTSGIITNMVNFAGIVSMEYILTDTSTNTTGYDATIISQVTAI